MRGIKIGDYLIGTGNPCFIIAEAGVNHNGSPDLAKKLVDAALVAGANAIKFQSFVAELVVSVDTPKADYQMSNLDESDSQLEMLQKLELSYSDQIELKNYCDNSGILFLSTPFDIQSAELLESLEIQAYKISSGDITNTPFLRFLASKAKPLIISTGMSFLGEIENALKVVEATGNLDYILMHCVSNYPTVPDDVNLRALKTMEYAFDVPVGFSDHTLGIEVSIAAVALGACVLEKHFTLDRTMPGPDHEASLEPSEFVALVEGVRKVERAMGNGQKRPTKSESNIRKIARRSLAAAVDIPIGTIIHPELLTALRPATGISPQMIDSVLNRVASRDIRAGELLDWSDI